MNNQQLNERIEKLTTPCLCSFFQGFAWKGEHSEYCVHEAHKQQLLQLIHDTCIEVIGEKHYVDEQCVKDNLYSKEQLDWLKTENNLRTEQLSELNELMKGE